MKRLVSALLTVVLPMVVLIGCVGSRSLPPPNSAVAMSSEAVGPALSSPANPELSGLFTQARNRGPLAIPVPGDKLPLTWGTRVPPQLYSALSAFVNHPILDHSASGQSVVVYLAVPKQASVVGGRTVRDYGACTLTVIGYQYIDHWEYAYSYYSGACYFDGGGPPPDGSVGGTVGTPSPDTNCGVPSSAQGNTAGSAINGSPALKNLTTFLANNHTLPQIKIDTTSIPSSSMTGKGIDASSDYDRTPSQGTITLFQKGLAASGHPVDQVLYHEMLHFYFVYGQYDLTGESAAPLLPTSGTATVTIGSSTYTYDLSDHSPNGGYQSYEHVLVHNGLVDAFGTDNTGALMEALNKVTPPLTSSQKADIINNFKSSKLNGSISASIPKGGQACGVTKYPSGRSRAAQSARTTHDIFNDMAALTFDSTYDITAAPATPPPAPPCSLDSNGFCGVMTYSAYIMCSPDESTSISIDIGPDIWDIYSSAGYLGTYWISRTPPNQYCTTSPDWVASINPAVVYGDPYLP